MAKEKKICNAHNFSADDILIFIGRSERGGHSSHVVWFTLIGWRDLETLNKAGDFKF